MRQKALGPVGETLIITNREPLSMSYTMTLMSTLDPALAAPLAIDLRTESNTQLDFLGVITKFLESKYLVAGDFLILDNWSGHFAADIMEPLLALCKAANVTIRFLPKYSPELNPCEMIFSLIKTHLRNHRGTAGFWLEILRSAASVTYWQVVQFYKHCIINSCE